MSFRIVLFFASLFCCYQLSGNGDLFQRSEPAEREMSDEEKMVRELLGLSSPTSGRPSESSQASDSGQASAVSKEEVREMLRWIRGNRTAHSRWILQATGALGGGYARNILKTSQGRLDAPFSQLEIETSAVWIRGGRAAVNVYGAAERTHYQSDEDVPSDEFYLLYAGAATGGKNEGRLSADFTGFHVRQVMEDPLQEELPSLFTLMQGRGRVGLERNFGAHAFAASILFIREEYDVEGLDSSSSGLELGHEWDLTGSLELESSLAYLSQGFDNRLSRDSGGASLDDQVLRLDRFDAEVLVRWKRNDSLLRRVDLRLDARREWSDASPYDRNLRLALTSSAELSSGRFTFTPSFSTAWRRYDERRVEGASDAEQQWQWRGKGGLKVKLKLAEKTAIELNYEYENVHSNRQTLEYEGDRVYALLAVTF
jgi:hypothetical protein